MRISHVLLSRLANSSEVEVKFSSSERDMTPFDIGATPRVSLALALKFAAYRAATCESEGRDLYRAVVDGQLHPKLAAVIIELDR